VTTLNDLPKKRGYTYNRDREKATFRKPKISGWSVGDFRSLMLMKGHRDASEKKNYEEDD